ncbi:MAG: fatty acid oxidation complex subunit alpha FadJ [Calditrichaeota bacterium]|nr:MAG: fatty acid oxidation complex subunit alpha FadJ [Calditrichota bacterium]
MKFTELELREGIAILWLDYPGEKINKISPELVDEFDALLDELEGRSDVEGVVLASRKPDNFIAGADLDVFLKMNEPGQAKQLSRRGHAVLNRLAAFPRPVVAAIHGAALGGGLEVALACHYRVASDDPATVLALPEVRLGLLPGGGGTQRLPRLIGIQRALNMMLTGKNVYPRQALRMGLVDELFHPHGVVEAALAAVRDLNRGSKPRRPRRTLTTWVLEANPLGRKLLFKKARQMVARQTMGNYPAPFKILECVEVGMSRGMKAGLEVEARNFDQLMRTPQCKALIQLFFEINSRKKNPLADQVRPVKRVGILGAGLMGSGIAQVSATSGLEVVLKDVSLEALGRAERQIYQALDRRVRQRALLPFQRDQILSRITPVTDYHGFDRVDLVIEAVFEDLELKRRVLAEVELETGEQTIFASNTSSLPIEKLAKIASRPTQVVGMHYFSPVPRMPLLEIVVTPKTEAWVTATAYQVGVQQGKTCIVVNDGPGFYTTRILAPLLNEALLLLEEGGDIPYIDRVMRQFGFPVGPFKLMDEVGIDVGAHVSRVLAPLFAKRGVTATDAMEKLVAQGFKGRKTGKGFYLYKGKKGRREVNPAVYRLFGGRKRKRHPVEEIQNRLVLVLVNEAIHCLQDGILLSPSDGDVGAVLGLGFPPFRGGPFRYVDAEGGEAIFNRLRELEQRFGNRFTPAELLAEKVRRGESFHRR